MLHLPRADSMNITHEDRPLDYSSGTYHHTDPFNMLNNYFPIFLQSQSECQSLARPCGVMGARVLSEIIKTNIKCRLILMEVLNK